jgi:hypothetical protein
MDDQCFMRFIWHMVGKSSRIGSVAFGAANQKRIGLPHVLPMMTPKICLSPVAVMSEGFV